MIDGPAYLQSLEGIILRWRCGQEVAHADIRNCYHQVLSSKKDISLRRVLLRPDGMGGCQPWQEAAFQTISFGDQLGGSSAQLAISDCFKRFVPHETRRNMARSLYMDDILVASITKSNPVQKMIQEVDNALPG